MKKKNQNRNQTKNKSILKKIWWFIWYDDSILSWIVNVALAFLIVKFIFYPGLSLIMGTNLPLVAVISPSMEHKPSETQSGFRICGSPTQDKGQLSVENWWDNCGNWYQENTNITLQQFKEFPLKNGFNKGDIIFLKGPRNLEIGDVIVFQSRKEYPIIHRIIEINETNIKTKGDNNPGLIRDLELNEERINPEAVVGKSYAKIPYLGYVKIWFTDLINLIKK